MIMMMTLMMTIGMAITMMMIMMIAADADADELVAKLIQPCLTISMADNEPKEHIW